MTPVIFCYADEDALVALEIGGFLEGNLPLACDYEEGRIRPGLDLIEAVRLGLSAEIAIILLSPDSAPSKWERKRWEGPLTREHFETGSRLFFLLVRECKFPELLRRQPFIDVSSDRTAGLRQLKRAILRKNPTIPNPCNLPPELPRALIDGAALDLLWCGLADQPGMESNVDRDLALQFAHAARDDFDGAFWIDCAGRDQAGVLGDTAHALGLRLSGAVEQNHAALCEIFVARRSLLVYEGLPAESQGWVAFGGRASVVGIAPGPAFPLMKLDLVVQLYSTWAKHPAERLGSLRHAEAWLRRLKPDTPESWRTIDRLGSAVFALLKAEDRLAEGYEILQILIEGARVQGDEDGLRRFQWSESWILGHWGEPYSASQDSTGQGARTAPVQPAPGIAQLGFTFS